MEAAEQSTKRLGKETSNQQKTVFSNVQIERKQMKLIAAVFVIGVNQ